MHGPVHTRVLSSRLAPVKLDDPLLLLDSLLQTEREALCLFLQTRHQELLDLLGTQFFFGRRRVDIDIASDFGAHLATKLDSANGGKLPEREGCVAPLSEEEISCSIMAEKPIAVVSSIANERHPVAVKAPWCTSVVPTATLPENGMKIAEQRPSEDSLDTASNIDSHVSFSQHSQHTPVTGAETEAVTDGEENRFRLNRNRSRVESGRGSGVYHRVARKRRNAGIIRSTVHQNTVDQDGWIFRKSMRRAARSEWFEISFAVLIVLNALVMCAEAQYLGFDSGREVGYSDMSRPASEVWPYADMVFTVLDLTFGVAFCIEVLVKVCGLRYEFVWSMWNWFDVLIVASWIVSSVFADFLPVQPSILRIVRLVRLLRILRLVKTVQVFDILHLMAASLRASMSVLLWSVVFLVCIMMSAALVMMSWIDFYISDAGNPQDKRLDAFRYFGNFTRSLLSVFELTLGNWVPITRFLHDSISEYFGIFFMFYYCLVSFAVVMVIRGIFLHETFQAAAHNDDLMIIRQARNKAKTLAKMEALFTEADDSGDGFLTHGEFMAVMNDHRVKTWLAAMGLEVPDADTVFELVDDGDCRISAHEFVQGFTRLKGPARCIDMVQVLRMSRNIVELLLELKEKMGGERDPQMKLLSSLSGKVDSTIDLLHHQSTNYNSSEDTV